MSQQNQTPANTTQQPAPQTQTIVIAPKPAMGRMRKRALTALALIFLLAAAAYALYWFAVSRYLEETDDAYVAGHVVQITSQVSGTVTAVLAEDTDTIAAGTVLVELDPADAKIALAQAEAALAQTVREVRTVYTHNNTLQAQIQVRQTDVSRLTQDLARREAIANTGAIAKEEIDHTREALKSAQSALVAAQEQLNANRAQTDGRKVAQHPNVLRASAKVQEAWLALARTKITAPSSGQIARRNVQLGQRINAGTPLMAVIAPESLWVDANFKEVQLRNMHAGQDVTLTSDFYGKKVTYHGRIQGLAAGTGSAFALLPAQNATGNWIKVVQRVPVRITLDPKELLDKPLRIGLSMQAEVDISKNAQSPALKLTPEPSKATETASDTALEEAHKRIEQIITENLSVKP